MFKKSLVTLIILISATALADSYVGIPAGITSLNNLTGQSQVMITGTALTDFNISSLGTTHTFNIPSASASNRGLLTPADWATFNAKQSPITPGSISTSTTGITLTGGSSSTVGPNVTIDIPNASSSVSGLLTAANFNTFNNKQNALLSASNSQQVWVTKGGSDTTGDGSFGNPYLTVHQALDSITDASSAKNYAIMIGPGLFSEPLGITLKPFVHLHGADEEATQLAVTGDIGISTTFTSGTPRIELQNIYIRGGTTNSINFDLQTLGGSNSTVFLLRNVEMNGSFKYKGRSSSDFYQIENSIIFGGWTVSGGEGTALNVYTPSNITINTTGITDAAGLDLHQSFTDGNMTITNPSKSFLLQMSGSGITGTQSISGITTTVLTDNVSLAKKSKLTLTAGTVNYESDAIGLSYTPITTGNWLAVPTTAQGALDTLGSGLFPFIGAGAGVASATNVKLATRNGHQKSTQTTAPTAKVTAAAGTGGTCTLANSTDIAGQFTLVTTATSPTSGVQCGINFNTSYNVAPICTFAAANAGAITQSVSSGLFITSTVATMGINFANQDAVGHTYIGNFHCIETQ